MININNNTINGKLVKEENLMLLKIIIDLLFSKVIHNLLKTTIDFMILVLKQLNLELTNLLILLLKNSKQDI